MLAGRRLMFDGRPRNVCGAYPYIGRCIRQENTIQINQASVIIDILDSRSGVFPLLCALRRPTHIVGQWPFADTEK